MVQQQQTLLSYQYIHNLASLLSCLLLLLDCLKHIITSRCKDQSAQTRCVRGFMYVKTHNSVAFSGTKKVVFNLSAKV